MHRRTDRKRCIWAHLAWAQVGSKTFPNRCFVTRVTIKGHRTLDTLLWANEYFSLQDLDNLPNTKKVHFVRDIILGLSDSCLSTLSFKRNAVESCVSFREECRKMNFVVYFFATNSQNHLTKCTWPRVSHPVTGKNGFRKVAFLLKESVQSRKFSMYQVHWGVAQCVQPVIWGS